MRKGPLTIALIAMIICIISMMMSVSAWAVPGLINYQGKLSDPNGDSLDGYYIVKFRLYAQDNAGTALWSEEKSIEVRDCIYNVQLGSKEPFSEDLFDNDLLYLEVEIFSQSTGWEILTPRQRLTSTAYAMKAADADTVDGKQADEFLSTSAEAQTKSGGLNIMGSVGIGTPSPGEALEVNGKIKATGFVGDGSNLTGIVTMETDPTVPKLLKDGVHWNEILNRPSGLDDGDDVGITSEKDPQVGSNTTNYVPKWNGSALVKGTIYDNGNIGIGTTSPGQKLHVAGATQIGALKFWGNASGDFQSSGDLRPHIGTENFIIYSGNVGSGMERLRVQSNGNVGIGTASPEAKLSINQSSNTYWAALIQNEAGDGKGLRIRGTDGASFDTTPLLRIEDGNANIKLKVQANGKVGIGTTNPNYSLHVNGDAMANNWYTPSDVIMKKNIATIDGALDKVSSLRGVEFEWRTEEFPEKDLDEGRKIGLIAQEVEEVLPEVVSTDDEGYKSVEYSNIVAVLVEAIKTQQIQIMQQQAQIEELIARVSLLEAVVRP